MDGMEAIEFTPPGRLLRFLEDSDMNDVYPMENTIHSLPYQDLEISGSNEQTVNITCCNIFCFSTITEVHDHFRVIKKLNIYIYHYFLSQFSFFSGPHRNNTGKRIG